MQHIFGVGSSLNWSLQKVRSLNGKDTHSHTSYQVYAYPHSWIIHDNLRRKATTYIDTTTRHSWFRCLKGSQTNNKTSSPNTSKPRRGTIHGQIRKTKITQPAQNTACTWRRYINVYGQHVADVAADGYTAQPILSDQTKVNLRNDKYALSG